MPKIVHNQNLILTSRTNSMSINQNLPIKNVLTIKQKTRLYFYTLMGIILFIVFTFLFVQFIQLYFEPNQKQQPQSLDSKRILSQQYQKSQIITIFQYMLDLVSNLANILKIIFQLTALLFIITDLVNFWNLASIYIFLPIQIPQFAKQILLNVWTQFNQPILSFFNVNFDTITFSQRQKMYDKEGKQYLSYLEVDVSELAFQPILILCVTAIELIFMTAILKWIKNSFRKINNKIHEGIKIENIFNQTTVKENIEQNAHPNLFQMFFKSNKIAPVDQKQHSERIQAQMQQQQSLKNIFQNDSLSTVTLQLQKQSNQQNDKSQTKHQIPQLNETKQQQIHPQLKIICLIHNLAKQKLQSSKNTFKKQKHWSQTIDIDKFQILSALLISFMPVLLLPLSNSIFNMRYFSIKSKINIVLYYSIVTVVFLFPFIYLIAKIGFKKIYIVKSVNKKGINGIKQNKHLNSNKSSSKRQYSFKKCNKQIQQNQYSLKNISIKQQTFQTFYYFFMNMTIPISAGIKTNPIWFLSINFIVHLLFVLSQVIFYPKKSCSNKVKKINKFIQKLTFLLYHICFIALHIFNSVRKELIDQNYMLTSKTDQIEKVFGIIIISLFAFGGLHEMIEFLIGILYDIFKIIYMVIHVLVGGYDLSELEEEMKKYKLSETFKNDKMGVQMKQYKNIDKNICQIRNENQQQKSVPKNTLRSLQQLEVDFQIQIIKNQIIIDRLKIQKLKSSSNSQHQQQYSSYKITKQKNHRYKIKRAYTKKQNQQLKLRKISL